MQHRKILSIYQFDADFAALNTDLVFLYYYLGIK